MRLSIIFLLVLALSAIITSMAAWGITFGTSYDRVTTMASQFSQLSQASLAVFGSFVTDLLQSNADLVNTILALQEKSGTNRTDQTKAQMARTIGVLVNYTANTTDQTQQQMSEVVTTFAGLMGTVVSDFRGLAGGYSAQLQSNVATKGMANVAFQSTAVGSAMRRVQQLMDIGLITASQMPTDPVGLQDCTLLSVICDCSAEIAQPVSFVSATGRLYNCSSQAGGLVSNITSAGGVYTERYLRWRPYAANVSAAARTTMKQRCLTEPPEIEIVGLNCPQSQRCQCGADQRCTAWYQQFPNNSASYLTASVFVDRSGPRLHRAFNIVNSSANPPALLGVVDVNVNPGAGDAVLSSLLTFLNETYLAMLVNDANLSVMGSAARKCSANDTAPPGNLSFPVWSGLRSCDPGVRTVAQWLLTNRPLAQQVTLQVGGLQWDVYPAAAPDMTYFYLVGYNTSLVNRPIDASEAAAASQLAVVRAALTSRVAASGAATRAYMADVGAQNIRATQAMQDAFLAEIHALENSSLASVAASQALTSANAASAAAVQSAAVDQEKVTQLNTMAVTAGWTIAVVFSILLIVLCFSAWGTVQVTNSLTHIILLMEDVAQMKVENLEVPESSGVQEVARIQTAFRVMVERLAEYKSYIPAGVLEQQDQATVRDDASEDGLPSDHESAANPKSARVSTSPRSQGVGSRLSLRSGSVVQVRTRSRPSVHHHGGLGMKAVTKPVAVLVVNVVGVMGALQQLTDGLSKSIFNEYVVHVHEVVSQFRGNIDFVAGDQIFVTFNAHMQCSDPAGAASSAALEVRTLLSRTLGGRLKFQLGASLGPVFAGSVGYAKFKFMLTAGSPMKLAAQLSHMDRFENGAIVADAHFHERMKYTYHLRPVELCYMPRLKSFTKNFPKSQRVYLLLSKKDLQEDEWLYQVGDGADGSDWAKAFDQLAAATSALEAQGALGQYLAEHPTDEVALRLRARLALWVPGKGIPL